MIERPSRDQSSALLPLPDSSSNSSSPVPFEFFTYRSRWPRRSEEKTMRLPSGDHTGLVSSLGSNVSFVLDPRARSNTQISRVKEAGSRTQTARRLPSGERAGLL